MIYVDTLLPCLRTKKWIYDKSCHLFADTVTELNIFAQSIGLKLSWLQGHTHFPHYDLTSNMRTKAISNGAHEVGARFVADFIKTLKGV